MTPNDVLPPAAVRPDTPGPGCPKFAWLKTLNTSTRSCTRAWPASRMFLMIDRSVSLKRGPRIAFRRRLPKWKAPLADTGSAKTELEVHEPAMRGSHTLLLNH